MQDPTTEVELLVEAMGTLATLSFPRQEWQAVMTDSTLPAWLARQMVVGSAPDDIILQAVILTATVCNEGSAHSIADAGLVPSTSCSRHAISENVLKIVLEMLFGGLTCTTCPALAVRSPCASAGTAAHISAGRQEG